jgi:phosphatidylglycerophosphate synthase
MLRLSDDTATAQTLPFAALPGAVMATFGVTAALASASTAAIVGDLVPASAVVPVAAVFGVVLWIVVRFLPDHRPVPRFGAANLVTFLRGAITAWLAGLFVATYSVETVGWWVAGAAGLALLLDGVDGLLARSRREASAFGARFDMETDALLLLVLSGLAIGADRVGVWVLAIGLMRYAFVAAGRFWPVMAAPLPPSFRRKTVAALQGIAMTLIFVPLLTDGQATVVAATALALLTGSFARDASYLLLQAREPVDAAR